MTATAISATRNRELVLGHAHRIIEEITEKATASKMPADMVARMVDAASVAATAEANAIADDYLRTGRTTDELNNPHVCHKRIRDAAIAAGRAAMDA